MLVLFQAGDNRFGVLKSHIIKMPDNAAISPPDNVAISSITFDEETIPYFDLSMLFGNGAASLTKKNRKLLVATTREGTVALKVDKVEEAIGIDTSQIFPLPPIFAEPATSCFPNVLRLQDDLIPLLDPNGIPRDINLYGLEESGSVNADSSVAEAEPPEPPVSVEKVEEAKAIPDEQTEEADISSDQESETPTTASLSDLEDDAPLPETSVDQESESNEQQIKAVEVIQDELTKETDVTSEEESEISAAAIFHGPDDAAQPTEANVAPEIRPNVQLKEDVQEVPEHPAETRENIGQPEKSYPAPVIRAEGPLLVIEEQPAACPPEIKPVTEPAPSKEPLPEELKEAEKAQQHPPSVNEEAVDAHAISDLQDTTPTSTNIEEISFAQPLDLPEDSLADLKTELSNTDDIKEEETRELSSLEKTMFDNDTEDDIADLSPADDLAIPAEIGVETDITILAPEDAVSSSEEKPRSSGFGSLIRRFTERRAKKRAARRRTLTS